MKPEAYLEITITSYLTAQPSRDPIVAANQQITQDWWQMRRTSFDLFISEVVVGVASAGDEIAARQQLDEMVAAR